MEIYGKNIFYTVGHRARSDISDRLERSFDPDWHVEMPNWEEIDLYDFIKSAAGKEAFITSAGKNHFAFRDKKGGSLDVVIEKENKGKTYTVDDFHNPVVRAILNFYVKNKDAAEPNDIFLELDKERAYGFVLLNVHTADIDVKMSNNPSQNHLMIRYNENTSGGWKERMQYISRIFKHMGFNTEIKGGYLHMHHKNPGKKEDMEPVLTEAIRGLVSTTHLNLSFSEFPHTLKKAVKAFKEGTTNVYDYVENLPEVKKAKEAAEAELKELGLNKEYKKYMGAIEIKYLE